MTQDEYILKVLNKIEGKRDPATHIKELLLKGELTPEYKSYIYHKFLTIINTILTLKKEQQQQAFLQHIHQLKNAEEQAQHATDQDIENLEKLLDSFA